jgi:uncharacterized repeat protein (TIGR01451 family)
MMLSGGRRSTPRATRSTHLWRLVSAVLIACAGLLVPASSRVQAQANGPSVALTMALIAPVGRSPAVGDTVVYKLDVTNNGNTILATVPMSDTFDAAYLEFASATLSTGGGAEVNAPPDIVQPGRLGWSDLTTLAGDLAVGATITAKLSFKAL